MTDAARLQARGVGKAFSGVRALDAVSVEVRAGEVLALMGENGAGKSTLLKILSGDYQPDAGELVLDGEPVTFGSPRDSHLAGVRVIHQEPEIIPHVSVAENVYVGALPGRGRYFDRRELLARTRADLRRFGFAHALDPALLGSQLSPAQRQLVEILRALRADVKVIAFDEPTSSLSDSEAQALFELIGRLRADGVAVIYVSHRLTEIFRVADRVTVLRDGKVVGSRVVGETDERELVRMMVGRDLANLFVREPHPVGDVVLSVRGLSTVDVTDIDLEVRAGEIVGLAGLVGAGRSELAQALVGNEPLTAGSIAVGGREVRLRQPRDAIRAGIGLAPEERKAQALLLDRTVRDNISLAVLDRLRRFRVVRAAQERAIAESYRRELNIRARSIEQEVRTLSGGNQQKTVLARWLARRPAVLILDEPTRGVDVGAKSEIYRIVGDLAASGVALLVISSELPEILGLADRIVVMQAGRISGTLRRDEATEEGILALAIADHLSDSGAPR